VRSGFPSGRAAAGLLLLKAFSRSTFAQVNLRTGQLRTTAFSLFGVVRLRTAPPVLMPDSATSVAGRSRDKMIVLSQPPALDLLALTCTVPPGVVGKMYALDTEDLIPLIGRTVRIRNGKHTFVGQIVGPSKAKFTRDNGRMYYGFTLEGDDFEMEFAWWDWFVEPVKEPVPQRA
jgi:hypothetical protein